MCNPEAFMGWVAQPVMMCSSEPSSAMMMLCTFWARFLWAM